MVTTRIKEATTTTGGTPKLSRRARIIARSRDYGIVGSFVALFIVLSITSPVFLTQANLFNLLDQTVTLGILACALTLVIISGGIDLSIGAIFAVSAIVAALVTNAAGTGMGLLAALATGAILGLINGFLTTVGRLNPFVASIATMMVFRGLALAISGGYLIVIQDPSFANIAQPRVLGLRVSVLIFIAVILVFMFLLNQTVFGRHIYAAGGNASAARLAGVRVSQVRMVTYTILGLSAALAGVISTSRTLTVDANVGTGIEFTAIAAVLVGGTSIMGGSGAIWRTVLGVLLLQLVGNGFNLMGVNPTYQQVFTGLIILIAVAWDTWIRVANRQ